MASEGIKLFSAFGKILLDDNGVEDKLKSITKQGKNTSSDLGEAFDKIKGTALKLGAALGISVGFKSMIDGASASQQKLAQMDAVLQSTNGAAGMTKDQLLALADAQGKVTTFSKGTNIETENMLLTFTGIGKKVFPDVLKVTNDMAQALGTDAKSAAMQLGKALNDPAEGVSKLTRVGVTFTDAQKKQIEAMEKAGDTAGAQKVMLQELQREFGGSAEAAGKTFAGQMTILKNQIGGVSSSLGMTLMPFLTELITKINNHMPQIKQTITDVINTVEPIATGLIKNVSEGLSKTLAPVFKTIGNIINDFKSDFKATGEVSTSVALILDQYVGKTAGNAFETLYNAVKNVFGFITTHGELVKGLIIGIGTAFLVFKTITGIISGITGAMKLAKEAQEAWSAITKIMTGIQAAFNVVLDANPIGLIILAIGLVVGALVLLYNNCKPFRDWVNSAFAELKKLGQEVGDFFVNMFKSVINFVKDNWKEILLFITNPIAGALALLYKLNPQFREWVNGLGKGIKEGFDNVVKFFENLPATALKWGKDMIDGLIKGITGGIGAIGDAAKGVAGKIASFLHFSVPDDGPLADADSYGSDFMDLITTGMESKLNNAQNMAKKVAQTISGGLNDNMNVGQYYNVNSGSGIALSSNNNSNNQTPVKQGDTYNINVEKVVADEKKELFNSMKQLARNH